MSGNFDGIKTQKYGVEVECTGLTRADAAKAISKILGGSPEHLGGSYDKYNIRDSKAESGLWFMIQALNALIKTDALHREIMLLNLSPRCLNMRICRYFRRLFVR